MSRRSNKSVEEILTTPASSATAASSKDEEDVLLDKKILLGLMSLSVIVYSAIFMQKIVAYTVFIE
jgi:hypothetical protein